LKISVITVSYNSEKTIRDTIESVLSQTYKNIEYIIVDGGSTDNTIKVIKDYETRFINANIEYKWISENDKGIYDALNKGIVMATGDVVGILNSDDFYFDTDVLSVIAESFKKHNFDCLYANLKYIDKETGKVTRDWKSRSFEKGLFEKSWTPAHPTFYCRKSVYEKYGLYRTDFKIAADVELMYRYLEINDVKSYYLDKYLVSMRRGGISNNGLKSTIIITKEMIKAYRDNGEHLNIFKYLLNKLFKLKELNFSGK